MKNSVRTHKSSKSSRALMIFGLFLTLCAASVHARAQSPEAVRITVPFQFSVGGKSFEAGEYTIKRLTWGGAAYAIQPRGGAGTSTTVMSADRLRAGRNTGPARLVFNAYAGHFFLSEIWMGAESDGLRLRRSPAEREVMRPASEGRRVTIVAGR